MKRDFLSILDLSADEIRGLLKRSLELKDAKGPYLEGKTLVLIFEKPSLRTRVSFEVAVQHLGGKSIYLDQREIGLGVREPLSDMARVLSRYVDAIVARTFSHHTLEALARHASIPVVNALSDREHPCQVLADLLTLYQRKGEWRGKVVAFIGDGNNVASSLALAAALLGMEFRIASPRGYSLPPSITEQALALASRSGGRVRIMEEAEAAVQGADVVYTDVWTSMGQEEEAQERRRAFAPYRVDERLLARAKPDALFMHPMPAHYGEEVPQGFLDHPQSVAFDQAENRLPVQKALLLTLLT